MEAGVVWTYMK